MNTTKLLLSRSDAAKALAVSLGTLSKLLRSGHIKTTRIGRAVRVHVDDLAEFARKGTAKTASSQLATC
jgi:excisionase family DNA binding protein